uniref:Tudor domain-containing protein n=1 Tax=Steinernema glaseri TaxID=37863 RepID=A0A1I7Y940_9BILA
MQHMNAFSFGHQSSPVSPPRPQRERIQRSDHCLLVRCFPANWDEWAVFHFFRKLGTVHNVYVPRPKEGSQHSFVPHAYLEMMNEAELQKVLSCCDYMGRIGLEGIEQMIEVSPYTPLTQNHRYTQQQRNVVEVLRQLKNMNMSNTNSVGDSISEEPFSPDRNRNADHVFEALGLLSPSDNPGSPKSALEEEVLSPLKSPTKAVDKLRRKSFKTRGDGSVVYDKSINRYDYLPIDRPIADVEFVFPEDTDAGFFYVLNKKHVAQFEKRIFEKRIVEQIRKAFDTALPVDQLKDKEIVQLKVEEDESSPKAYARAVNVGKVSDKGDYKMLLVDRGITGTFNISSMRKISNDVARKPFLAIRCELYGLDGKQPVELIREVFKQNIATVQVRLIAFRGLNSLIQCHISCHKSNGSRTKSIDLAQYLAERIPDLKYAPPKNEKLVYTKEQIMDIKKLVKSAPKSTIPVDLLSEMFADIFVSAV